jgi:hypothetical protein
MSNTDDASSNSRDAASNGGVSVGLTSLIGNGSSLDGIDDEFSINGYNGINGSSPRSISMWVKFDKNESMGLVGWGSTGNFWNYEWNYPSGPRVKLNANAVEQGLFNLSDDQWHHLAFSFPNGSSDLNETKLFVDGYLVDAPALSTSETVNTGSGSVFKIG